MFRKTGKPMMPSIGRPRWPDSSAKSKISAGTRSKSDSPSQSLRRMVASSSTSPPLAESTRTRWGTASFFVFTAMRFAKAGET